MKSKYFTSMLLGLLLGVLVFNPGKAFAEQVKTVIVENFPELLNVEVQNWPDTQSVEVVNEEPIEVTVSGDNGGVQLWDYWYQCHPNPTNEAEIRGYLNDRGDQGWEVVAAAGPGGLICEYYKRPRQ